MPNLTLLCLRLVLIGKLCPFILLYTKAVAAGVTSISHVHGRASWLTFGDLSIIHDGMLKIRYSQPTLAIYI
jgi:hypothetical protein